MLSSTTLVAVVSRWVGWPAMLVVAMLVVMVVMVAVAQAMVFGICGSLVVWCRLCKVDGWSSVTEVRTFAEPAMVFIFDEFLDDDELGVRNVPDGLSELSRGGRGSLLLSHACLRAALGVILVAGSHSRHRRMKSVNRGSSQPLRAVCSSLDPGGPLGLPRRDLPPLRTVEPSGRVVAVQ